jgi:hypothetical protein
MSAPNETPLPHVPGAPARSALAAAGIESLDDLAAMSRKAVLALHGMGPKAFAVLEKAMETAELSFRE